MQIDTNGFALGDVARDEASGFEGTIIGFTQWRSGCAVATIQPRVGSDGKHPDSAGFDVTVIELVTAGPHHAAPVAPRTRNGGPHPEPRRNR